MCGKGNQRSIKNKKSIKNQINKKILLKNGARNASAAMGMTWER